MAHSMKNCKGSVMVCDVTRKKTEASIEYDTPLQVQMKGMGLREVSLPTQLSPDIFCQRGFSFDRVAPPIPTHTSAPGVHRTCGGANNTRPNSPSVRP